MLEQVESSKPHAARATPSRGALAALSLALASFPAGAAGAVASGSVEAGERLFSGEARFANGGPPCGACHAVAELPFPGGGTMGPDLTGAYPKYGPEAMDMVLATLFFPTMNPIFAGRLLTPAERADLQAFLTAVGTSASPRAATGRLLLGGLLLFAGATALIAWLGRARLRGVRAALVGSARRAREGRP